MELINHPNHYGGADNPYETIKVIEAWGLDFTLGNAVKYISRAGKKEPDKNIQDLEKAIWYLQRRITQLQSVAAYTKPGSTTKCQHSNTETFKYVEICRNCVQGRLRTPDGKFDGWQDLKQIPLTEEEYIGVYRILNAHNLTAKDGYTFVTMEPNPSLRQGAQP